MFALGFLSDPHGLCYASPQAAFSSGVSAGDGAQAPANSRLQKTLKKVSVSVDIQYCFISVFRKHFLPLKSVTSGLASPAKSSFREQALRFLWLPPPYFLLECPFPHFLPAKFLLVL